MNESKLPGDIQVSPLAYHPYHPPPYEEEQLISLLSYASILLKHRRLIAGLCPCRAHAGTRRTLGAQIFGIHFDVRHGLWLSEAGDPLT